MDKQQAQAGAVRLLKAIYEAIKEAGPQGIPSGHLYAACGMPGLSQWANVERTLIDAKLVEKRGDLLVAVA